MRKRKIRGHRRRWKAIETWRIKNSSINMDQLNQFSRDYVKIGIYPWYGSSRATANYPEPNGKTKRLMLEALLEIYSLWKTQLDTLNQPYYLKIWLHDPRFSHSQVVCAIGQKYDFYDNTFFDPEANKAIELNNYGTLASAMSAFSWEHRLDEWQIDSTETGSPEDYKDQDSFDQQKAWFEKLLRSPHRTTSISNAEEDFDLYSFPMGDVWLGESLNPKRS